MAALYLSEVVDLVCDRFKLTNAGAVRARLQHFQRLGFPAGMARLRGRWPNYDDDRVRQVLVAFALLDAGLTPAVIVDLLAFDWVDVRHGLTLGRRWLLVSPRALNELRDVDDGQLLTCNAPADAALLLPGRNFLAIDLARIVQPSPLAAAA